MADTKITSLLTPQVTTNPATDVLPIVNIADTSMATSGSTRKITVNQLLGSGGTATLASATITGDLTVRTNRLATTTTGVGIGTASPIVPLDVRGGAGAGALFLRTTDPTAAVSSAYIQTPVSTGFSALVPIYGFWYQNCGMGNPASDAVTLITASTERYRIDSAGTNTWSNVGGAGTAMTLNANGLGIGVTPSAWATYKAVSVGGIGASVFGLGTSQAGIAQGAFFNNGAGSGWAYSATSQVPTYYLQINGENIWNIAASGTAGAQITAWTPAMKLDASGNLLVGKTATNSGTVGVEIQPNGNVWATKSASTSAATAWDTYSTGAGAYRFYVGMDGTVNATNTTISAISDARLKENVQDIDVGLGAILALKPRKFDWKAGKGKDIKGDRGFIAQEFEEVFPQLVDEWKDAAPEGEAPYKSVRQDLIPVLVKAIQELTARVQTLETR